MKFLWAIQECSRLDWIHNANIQAEIEAEEFATNICHYKINVGWLEGPEGSSSAYVSMWNTRSMPHVEKGMWVDQDFDSEIVVFWTGINT